MYSEIEKLDAERLREIDKCMKSKNLNWDKVYNDLLIIYDHIPDDGYLNSFEKNGKLYYKFWDQDEFMSYCSTIQKKESELVWIGNAYPKCCYMLAIICIERGEFEDALRFLYKGLELEPDNPLIMSEMGLLFGQIGSSTGDEEMFHNAIACYENAYKSRPFNTDCQKARALRGTGYILIELGEFELAKGFYESSLTFDESELARNELDVIEKHLSGASGKIYRTGSNLIETKNIPSFDFYAENRSKLSDKLQDIIPDNFYLVWYEASVLLCRGFDEYRKNNLSGYPLVEWDEPAMMPILDQIVYYLKGIAPDHSIETDSIESAQNLLLTFEFELNEINPIKNKKREVIQEITFKYKVDNEEIKLYFSINNAEGLKKKWWKIW